MSQFYFNLYDDIVSTDEEGRDLPSITAAHDCAVMNAHEMARAEVLEGHLHLGHRIDVADKSGTVVDTVRFGDVVNVVG